MVTGPLLYRITVVGSPGHIDVVSVRRERDDSIAGTFKSSSNKGTKTNTKLEGTFVWICYSRIKWTKNLVYI